MPATFRLTALRGRVLRVRTDAEAVGRPGDPLVVLAGADRVAVLVADLDPHPQGAPGGLARGEAALDPVALDLLPAAEPALLGQLLDLLARAVERAVDDADPGRSERAPRLALRVLAVPGAELDERLLDAASVVGDAELE